MSAQPIAQHAHCHCCHADHCTPKNDPKKLGFQEVLEIVCRVALTTIAMISHPISTICGLAGGLGYGLYIGYLENKKGFQVQKGGDGGCAHGFLEELSGVRFPKAFNTVAAFGITLEHLMDGCGHHGHSPIPFSFFSVLAGISTGAWLGRGMWYVGRSFTTHAK